MTAPRVPLVGGLLGERYRVGDLLASGGMGAVHLGIDERLGREVAIKILRAELSDEDDARRRFEREAFAVARIGHPNVAQVLDFGRASDRTAFLVMECVPGETFAKLLAREGRVEARRAADLARQALDGLAAAHAAGVVHRDIKPGNLMTFFAAPEREVVKVLDFGVARLMETQAYTRLTVTGVIVGTPAYMSPEQARGEPIDARTDVYAMGVLLYCLLAGRRPFQGDVAAILDGVLHLEPPSLASHAPTTPPPLIAIVERAMRKQPSERFATATEMSRALLELARVPHTSDTTRPREALLAAPSQTSARAPSSLAPRTSLLQSGVAPPNSRSLVSGERATRADAVRAGVARYGAGIGQAALGAALVTGVLGVLALVAVGVGWWWWTLPAAPPQGVSPPMTAPVPVAATAPVPVAATAPVPPSPFPMLAPRATEAPSAIVTITSESPVAQTLELTAGGEVAGALQRLPCLGHFPRQPQVRVQVERGVRRVLLRASSTERLFFLVRRADGTLSCEQNQPTFTSAGGAVSFVIEIDGEGPTLAHSLFVGTTTREVRPVTLSIERTLPQRRGPTTSHPTRTSRDTSGTSMRDGVVDPWGSF